MVHWVLILACRPDPDPVVSRLAAAMPPSTALVERVDGGMPVVAVVEVADSDPRAPDGAPADAVEAADAVVRALVGAGAQPIPSEPPDPATVEALRRFADLVEAPETALGGLRDLVLAGAAPPAAVERYEALRREVRIRLDEVRDGALVATDRALAERGAVVLAVPGVVAEPVMARIRSAGATGIALRPAALAELPPPRSWWAGLEAALPPVVPPDGDLPSWDGWAAVLRAGPPSTAPPPCAELPPGDPLRDRVTTAAADLPALPGLPAEPVAVLASLRWCGDPRPGTPASYDPLYDALRLDPAAGELPPDLLAAVIAHELVHVADLRALAARLGTDPAGWARLHDGLPAGVMRGVATMAEDRALRVEVALVDARGIWLPRPLEADRIVRDPGSTDADRLRATLSILREARPGTFRWMEEVARLVQSPR